MTWEQRWVQVRPTVLKLALVVTALILTLVVLMTMGCSPCRSQRQLEHDLKGLNTF